MEESTDEESSVEKENPDDEIVVMPKRRKANTTTQESEDNSDKEEPKSKRTRRHKKISLTVEKGKPKSKLLRKEERDIICQKLNDTDIATTLQELVCIIKEQAVSHPYIIQLLDELIRNDSLCQDLVKHHISVFIYLYNQCSAGKEKFLRFQLQWHIHCSIFLLPKDEDISSVLPKEVAATVTGKGNASSAHPKARKVSTKKKKQSCTASEQITLDSERIRTQWLQFCDTPYPFDGCKKLMMMFSSNVYNIMLQKINKDPVFIRKCPDIPIQYDQDPDDVYYRFGGASLSDMLHVRYNKIRRSQTDKSAATVSEEIFILQAINTKDKSHMPSYLKYRDRGFMYTPLPIFVPFIRNVDTCVQEVVNQAGFQTHGDEIIKVSTLHKIIICKKYYHFLIGGSCSCSKKNST